MTFDPNTLYHLLFSLEESDMQQEIPKQKASPEIPNHFLGQLHHPGDARRVGNACNTA